VASSVRNCDRVESPSIPGNHGASGARARSSLACLVLSLLCACDAAPVGRVIWHVGDSTSVQLGEELEFRASLRHQGDVIVGIVRLPGGALGRDLAHYTRRLRAAHSPLVPEAMAAQLEIAGLPVPRRLGEPDLILIQLGSNDLTPHGDPTVFQLVDTNEELDTAIAALLAALPPGVPVLWVEPGPFVGPQRGSHFLGALQRAGVRTLRLPDAFYFDGIHFGDEIGAARDIVSALDTMPAQP
jgi:hypothetical protein